MKYYFCLSNTYQILLPVPKFTHEIVNQKTGQVLAKLNPNGLLTVFSGYAWDGCSPRFNVLGLFWVGIPNGVHHDNEKPMMYYPSLVHDVLLQMGSPYDNVHELFLELGKDFPLIKLYYWAVKLWHLFPR
jgi:hypothetical protein